ADVSGHPREGPPPARDVGARARRARRSQRSPFEPALRWPAAARRDRACPRDRGADHHGRRADRQPRHEDVVRGDGDPARARRAGQDGHPRHARAGHRGVRAARDPAARRQDHRRQDAGTARREQGGCRMNIFTTLKLAFRALWRNKVRSMLTMLGIVFGIGAVIAMVAGGQGAQASVRQVFQNLGTNVIQVMNGSVKTGGAAGGMGSRMSLTWDDLAAIEDPTNVPTVHWVAPLLNTRGQVASDEQNWNTTIYGTT